MGYFLMFIAVSIAGVAAYFSVYGLAHIFAATFWSVVLMGCILEIGKLVATSFLYRYWDHLKFALKAYLFIAIIGLMALTSAGIFGYLSNAYQQDIVGVKDVAARIKLLDIELATLVARENRINEDVGRIGSNYVSARQNLIKQYAPEKAELNTRIVAIRVEQLDLSTKQLEVEAHTGPIIYIAKAMDKGVDEAVVWMICLIIFVFDPLAVALTIGANIALTTKRANDEKQLDPPGDNGNASLSQELLDAVAASSTQYLIGLGRDLLKAEQQDQPIVPPGMVLITGSDYQSLRSTATDVHALEDDLILKQDMIESLSTDNERLEDELFTLAAAFEKKDATINQLRDAVVVMEQASGPLNIQQRAALHQQNQVAAKTT